MIEVWKDIVEFENLYQISNYGRIKSYYGKNGKLTDEARLLHGKLDKDGYVEVRLCKKGAVSYRRIHRLVAEHFLEGDAIKQVNHKDGNKQNNMVDNLEWVTVAENIRHAHDTGLHKGCVTRVYVKHGEVDTVFDSITKAASYFKVNRGWFRSHVIRYGNPFMHEGMEFHLVGGKCGSR